jgi:hypothetical protein
MIRWCSCLCGKSWSAGARLVLLLTLIGAGCSKPEPIRRYSVEKPPHRMLAAMLPQGKEAWFLKLSGPRADIARQRDAFESFLKSVQIEAGATKPAWKLPDGWKEGNGPGERVATIEVPGSEKSLELTVTKLPIPERNLDDYKLENVNRWRQQIRLGPLTSSQFKNETREIASAGEEKWTVVDLVGTMSPPRRGMGMGGMGMGMGSMGSGGAMGPGSPIMGGDEAVAGPPPFDHRQPKGWKLGPPKPLRKLTYLVSHEGQAGEVTVISLPAAVNDLLSNVNRWREQVKLPPVDEAGLAKLVQPISLGDSSGSYVELKGTGEGGESILGVMAVRGEEAWFFKFKGPSPLIEHEKTRFDEFVKSVRFK